jgi:two-component system, NtrC family, sensor kinase
VIEPGHDRLFVIALVALLAGVLAFTIKVARLNRKLAQSKAMLEREIAERKRMEHQIRVSERMSSLGQLAAGIAHEMNSPLGYVYSNIVALQSWTRDLFRLLDAYEAAEADMPPAPVAAVRQLKEEIGLAFLRDEFAAAFKENREGITRAKNIVQDMLVLSRVADEDWREVDLNDGLRSTLGMVHKEIEQKAKILTEWGDLPRVRCLAAQLNQVFLNLLLNARDAVDEGGVITVRTGTEGDRVYFEVADDGQGIPPDVLRRIFDPFFTTKPVGQGTGLGLVVSHRIVGEHGGEILVNSEAGSGTTFRVVIPRAPKPKRPRDDEAGPVSSVGARALGRPR